MRTHLILMALLAPATLAAAPGPLEGGAEGWRFAVCRMESICRFESQRCGDVPSPGDTYIWRDENGLRLGTSYRAANPITAYSSPEEAVAELTEDFEGSVLVIPPEGEGTGWMWIALFEANGGALQDLFFQLSCTTRDEAPPEPPDLPLPELPSPPEMPPPPASEPEAID